jgi:hypothetical protein
MQVNNTYHAMSMTEIIEMKKEVKALKEEKGKIIKEFEKILNLFEMDELSELDVLKVRRLLIEMKGK